tara:strand:+ start:4288 stop:4866 length:579 start_codon:yes stop_codon:yes gene_type:complete
MKTYYCTANWHDYPKGGTYGDLVQATDYEDAEEKLRLSMTASYIESFWVDEDWENHEWNPESDEDHKEALKYIKETYGECWTVVDCYPYVDNFINNLGSLTDAEKQQLREALNTTIREDHTMKLNEYQNIARENYADGDYASTDEYRDVGDGLYTALMTELSDNEDCESRDMARNRVARMIRDLEDVLEALK